MSIRYSMSTTMILAGDIGGTNTRLAIFSASGTGKLAMRDRRDFKNHGRDGLEPIVREFCSPMKEKIALACFGVAGPVKDGRALMTHLKWTLDERKLASSLKIARVALINDLVAHAEGINQLKSKDITTLHRGQPMKRGNRAILAPGTGLGEAGLVFESRTNDYRAFASEGGHCDFAPKDDRQMALLSFVLRETRWPMQLGRCAQRAGGEEYF